MSVAEIFDRNRRRQCRDRAAQAFAAHAFLIDQIGQSLLERLDSVSRSFTAALDLGCHDGRLGRQLEARGMAVRYADAGARFAALAGGVQCDEDRLPFSPGSFDLVVSAGVLDQVNDLPGALIQIRRALKPDGLLLAGFVGAGSLPALRRAAMMADLAAGEAVGSRVHPQIDIRAAGDLLSRAGFALPVADSERVEVRYRDPRTLIADLRGMGASCMLTDRAPSFDLAGRAALMAALGEDCVESFEIVYLTAWSPGPDQPQPARRGSATASLADALKSR